MKKKILVTGSAGFIGFHTCDVLLRKGYIVYGIDNYSKYYDLVLKKKRTTLLKKQKKFKFCKFDLFNKKKLDLFFKKNKFDIIIHLAGQPGVRLSFLDRTTYFRNNLEVFFNMMEICLKKKIKHFIYASSSSVYGDTKKFPNIETDNTDNQVSFYAATKKCNEIIASSYSKMCDTKFTALRFFTVYGPLGRPDMALFKFAKNIHLKKKINLFNNGNHSRDFTYIEDVTNLLLRLVKRNFNSLNNHDIFNLCHGKTVNLKTYIGLIEKNLGTKANKNFISKQRGDVLKTYGDNKKILRLLNYKIRYGVEEGVKIFSEWFKKYTNV